MYSLNIVVYNGMFHLGRSFSLSLLLLESSSAELQFRGMKAWSWAAKLLFCPFVLLLYTWAEEPLSGGRRENTLLQSSEA